MKKNLISFGMEALILAAIAAAVITACVDGIPTNPFLSRPFNAEKNNAEVPVISSHPQSAVYTLNAQAADLTVTASVGDGGTLSYQWYSNASDSIEDGTAITGEIETNYTPPTDTDGTVYYYVIVTNSLNGKTAEAASHTAKIEVNENVNAAVPHISAHPQGAEYSFGDEAEALTVTASVSDGGELSYRWYSNAQNSNEGGTKIEGETGASYTPPTNQPGTVYYYVAVANTITDNGDGGNKIAVEVSDVAGITVEEKVISIVDVTVTAPAKGNAPVTTATVDDEGYTCGAVSWSPDHDPFRGNTKYTATVTLTAKEHHIFAVELDATINNDDAIVTHNTGEAVTLSLEFDATLDKMVSGISIKTQPSKLSYTHGDTLDLDGLVVTLTHDDGTGEDVEFAHFGTNISTHPANGAALHRPTNNNHPVVLSFGELTANTNNLTVNTKTLTVTGASHTRPYDGTTTASGVSVTFSGIVGDDDVSAAAVSAEYTNAAAGTQTVNITAVTLTGTAAGNYTVTPANNIIVTGGGITKADPTVTWPTGLTGYYAFTLAHISLPGNGTSVPAGMFTWTTPSTSIGDLGTQSHSMTFTPTDTANYNTLTQNVNIIVRLVEMVWVAGGSFQMGQNGNGSTDNVTPVHTVTLTGFYIGKYEVTQALYQMVMGTNPSGFTTGADAGETQSRRPVENVSWYDALVFCNKLSMAEGLSPAYRINGSTDPAAWGTVNATWDAVEVVSGSNGYRLPTEAQWEYAAKGGQSASNPYKIYSGSDDANTVAWYIDKTGTPTNNKTHEVGKLVPNELGIYDMSGNVWEWCWDRYGTYPSEAQTDPVGASSGFNRTARGGSFENSAMGIRSRDRGWYELTTLRYEIGFRLVRPAQ